MSTAASPMPRVRWSWWVMAIFAIPIAGYAFSHLVIGEAMYSAMLAESFRARPWGILPHVLLGGIALLAGPLQFHPTLRTRHLTFHRNLGRVYVVCATAVGAVGMYMAAYSYGGWITHLGFGLLGAVTVGTTLMAYTRIRERRIDEHRRWMIRSYALVYAAVTLRVEIPILIAFFGGEFLPAYQVVAWLSWVPNIVLAEWYVRRRPYARAVPVRREEGVVANRVG